MIVEQQTNPGLNGIGLIQFGQEIDKVGACMAVADQSRSPDPYGDRVPRAAILSPDVRIPSLVAYVTGKLIWLWWPVRRRGC
jgi:hypothetical protein